MRTSFNLFILSLLLLKQAIIGFTTYLEANAKEKEIRNEQDFSKWTEPIEKTGKKISTRQITVITAFNKELLDD